MSFGPMQMLIVGFGDVEATGEISAELARLREHDIVRLVDLLIVSKDASGSVAALEASDLSKDESAELGALAGALIGLGAAGEEGAEAGAVAGAAAADNGETLLGQDVWYVADAIPPGTTAAVAILEHRWAIPLRDAIAGRGGVTLADAWVHPADLVAVGAATATERAPVSPG
jgi:uncharacterized membrane protein